jgi:hypothetical protein
MGMLMGVIAYILEKVVMRSIRREGGVAEPKVGGGTTVTTKGAEIDVDELRANAKGRPEGRP